MTDLAERFRIQSVQWRTQRWDQLSGMGSGDVLAAQLAPPRIVADIVLMPSVTPHLRPGTVADLAVNLKKPAAKVFIVPDSFQPGTAQGIVTTGMSFQVMQRP